MYIAEKWNILNYMVEDIMIKRDNSSARCYQFNLVMSPPPSGGSIIENRE